MQLQQNTVTISKNEGRKILTDYFKSQKNAGLIGGVVGILSLVLSFVLIFISSDFKYFAFVLFIFGMIKSVIYFSDYFIMKTKISINLEMYDLDPNSFIIEQKFQMDRTKALMKNLMFGYSATILLILTFLITTTMSVEIKRILLVICLHGVIACFIFFWSYRSAKSYGQKLGNK